MTTLALSVVQPSDNFVSWLKLHFDFSEKMLVDLNHFLEQLASDDYQNLSNQIKAHISRQVKGEEVKKKYYGF